MHILGPKISFPHPDSAHESGVLAIGGDLELERLLLAYQYGIFPWYNEDEPIVWWHPDPRFVLYPSEVTVAKSMRSIFNQNKYRVTIDQQFSEVIYHCKYTDRKDQDGTWISDDIIEAYSDLHDSGYAHSVEVWSGDEVVGGLYGISLGKVFYGESMFSHESNASKVALIALARLLEQRNFYLIDCQIGNPHLEKMGGKHIPRSEFLKCMQKNTFESTKQGSWADMTDGITLKQLL